MQPLAVRGSLELTTHIRPQVEYWATRPA
jgi:hypothetical protein